MQSISKALAGLIAGAVVPFFTIFGVTGSMPFENAIEMIVFGIITAIGTFATVYLAPKDK